MKVLNIGSLNLDYVYQVDHFVQPGETLSAYTQTVNPGGKGLNQSVALARAGAEVYHAGCVGVGGESLLQVLQKNHIDTTWMYQVDEIQGNTVIQVTPSGENCILLFGGSNQRITSEQIDSTLSAFSHGDYLILQNEVNNLPEIVDKAFEKGLKIILNPSPYNEKMNMIDLDKISWLLVNEIEAEQISGKKDVEEIWSMIHNAHPNLSLLITLGGKGSVAWHVEKKCIEKASQESFHVQAIDTTGAGDTYTGYFVSALLEERPLQECMKRASLAAAISVTRRGAADSIPERNEVEKTLL